MLSSDAVPSHCLVDDLDLAMGRRSERRDCVDVAEETSKTIHRREQQLEPKQPRSARKKMLAFRLTRKC